MRHVVIAGAITLCCALPARAVEPPFWPCEPGDGSPFGHLTKNDESTLIALASASGLELVPTVKEVGAGDKEALADVLRLSSRLNALDMPTRVYGNMLYSIFLNLGEAGSAEVFMSVLLSQDPAVRQRIKDLLWYPIFCVPEAQRVEVARAQQAEFPRLWPPDFVFGRDGDLFSKTPNNALQPSDPADTPPAKQASRQPAGG